MHIVKGILIVGSKRVNKLMQFLQLKNQIFVFEIKALVARNCAIAGILVVGSQRVNKQFKISDQTNADFFQLNISQMHGKIG